MPNKWIEFVKKTQRDKNISYKDALTVAKTLYNKGGSINSDKVKAIYYMNPSKFNINRVKDPSEFLIKEFGNKRPTLKQIKQHILKIKMSKGSVKTQMLNELQILIKRYQKNMNQDDKDEFNEALQNVLNS